MRRPCRFHVDPQERDIVEDEAAHFFDVEDQLFGICKGQISPVYIDYVRDVALRVVHTGVEEITRGFLAYGRPRIFGNRLDHRTIIIHLVCSNRNRGSALMRYMIGRYGKKNLMLLSPAKDDLESFYKQFGFVWQEGEKFMVRVPA